MVKFCVLILFNIVSQGGRCSCNYMALAERENEKLNKRPNEAEYVINKIKVRKQR